MNSSAPEELCRPARMIIVDDEPVVLAELARLCASDAKLDVVGTASTVAAARKMVEQPHDLLLLDLGLPDGTGYELLASQQAAQPQAKCLILTVFGDRTHVLRALEQGADGYILKHSGQILSSIASVLSGRNPLDPEITSHLMAPLREAAPEAEVGGILTRRERDTLAGLARGLSYRQIASELSISPHTLTDYVKALYRKLSVSSRSQAVYVAHRRGLVDL